MPGSEGAHGKAPPHRLLMEPVSRGRGFPAKSLMNKTCSIFLIFPSLSCSVGLAVSVAEACHGPGWVGIPMNAQWSNSGLGGKCKNGEVSLSDSFFLSDPSEDLAKQINCHIRMYFCNWDRRCSTISPVQPMLQCAHCAVNHKQSGGERKLPASRNLVV